jgi:hypothetical protein
VSNLLKSHYFTLPLDLGQRMATMSDPALRIYVCLFRMANQHSAPTIEIPAYLLEDWTGLSESSVLQGARELANAGLVTLAAGPHRTTRYTLNDPSTIRESGERREPATKKRPARIVKLFTGIALDTPSKFRGMYRVPTQQGRSSRTKREIAKAARETEKAAAESASKPFCPPTADELFGDHPSSVPCLAVNKTMNSMDTVRNNHGTDSSKSLKKRNDSGSLLKDSEERILKVGCPKPSSSLNRHWDDGRGYPASWDDIAPEWEAPSFIVIPKRTREYKKLVASMKAQPDFDFDAKRAAANDN